MIFSFIRKRSTGNPLRGETYQNNISKFIKTRYNLRKKSEYMLASQQTLSLELCSFAPMTNSIE